MRICRRAQSGDNVRRNSPSDRLRRVGRQHRSDDRHSEQREPPRSALTLGGNSGTACIGGNTATLDFGFSDAGVNDSPWSVDIDWGDGNHTTYDASSQGAQTQRSHLYAAGSYAVSVSVTDKDGGTVSNSSAAGAVSFLYNVSGVLQPVNNTQAHNDPSVFKYGSTIPVKIKVTDCNNLVVSGLSPQIAVRKISWLHAAIGRG